MPQPFEGLYAEKERVILLKTLTTVASVALPIEERWEHPNAADTPLTAICRPRLHRHRHARR